MVVQCTFWHVFACFGTICLSLTSAAPQTSSRNLIILIPPPIEKWMRRKHGLVATHLEDGYHTYNHVYQNCALYFFVPFPSAATDERKTCLRPYFTLIYNSSVWQYDLDQVTNQLSFRLGSTLPLSIQFSRTLPGESLCVTRSPGLGTSHCAKSKPWRISTYTG